MAYPNTRRKYTIVGIDPGTTVGIAMIDLNGKPVDVFSAKNYSISDAIARIESHGTPLIVASDVTPTPAMIKKISSMFAAPGHDLVESLSTEEKIALTKGEGYEYKNAHERDALAACVNAFKRYKKKFAQVQKKTPAGMNAEEVKALVVKGVSISAAISRLTNAEEERRKVTEEERLEEKKSSGEKESKIILRLRGLLKGKDERIELLEERTTALKASSNEKEREARSLKRKLDSMRSERTREIRRAEEIRKRDTEIERLVEEVRAIENENAELRKVIAGLKGKREVKGGKRIKVIQSFSQDAILDMDRKYGLNKGDIVFLVDGSGGGASTAELLAKKGVAAVLYSKELSHFAADKFFEFGIPSFSTDKIPLLLKEEGDFASVDRHLLNERIEEWKKRERRRKKVILLR
ncbi:MAG TPA: DUF460 domain-containing protein [Candidatus Bathyarchaeia archaeon]|nr:DUF460 domain-containing protein [Candidatus Bathyarchaeia archaeon]